MVYINRNAEPKKGNRDAYKPTPNVYNGAFGDIGTRMKGHLHQETNRDRNNSVVENI